MQKNIKLAISTPCHEKWNSFAKTAQGGFCESCQKEVIDFKRWNEDQLKMYFKKPGSNTCGRFKQEQLKVYTLTEPSSSKINWLSFVLVSMLVLFSSKQASANTDGKLKGLVEQVESETKFGKAIVFKRDSSIVLQGKVIYASDSTTLPGVNVTCKRTTNTTVTDENGNFKLTLKSSLSSETLVLDFIGLKTVEYVVNKNELNKIRIVMEDDLIALNEKIIVGGVCSTHWYGPRRWWLGVKGWFRK